MKKEATKKNKCCKFLKPNLKKILIGFGLLIFSYLLLPLPITYASITWPVPQLTVGFSPLSNSPRLMPLVGIQINYFGINSILGEIVGIIFLIIISYVISSWIISKLRKNKKK